MKLLNISRGLSQMATMSRMKSALVLAFLAATCVFASDRISEESAVTQLKKATASQLDPSLPSRSFGSWVSDKFRDWDIQWEIHDCGDLKVKTAKGNANQEGSVCVQVNIMQPGQKIHGEGSDGFHLLFLVGMEKRGLMPPRLRSASRTDGDEVSKLQGLSEVEP
jgi:hypothetical protein